MGRIVAAVCLLWCSVGMAGITVTPAQTGVGSKVIATVTAQIPKGATFDGGWTVSGKAEHEKLASAGKIGIWGPAGTYEVKYSGFWILLKEVSFKDGDGNTVVIQSYLGHGFINEQATFVLEGTNGPDPPDPPGPVGPWKIVLFYESSRLDNLTRDQQSLLRGEWVKGRLQERGHELVQRVQGHPSSYPPELREFVTAVRGKSLPRVALQGFDGGTVYHYPLPDTWEGFLASLTNPKLTERK